MRRRLYRCVNTLDKLAVVEAPSCVEGGSLSDDSETAALVLAARRAVSLLLAGMLTSFRCIGGP
jgi:hypothetical protein